MARPLQYQSQFVPTDFNQVGNILGMFRQDMQQRNQEYDQSLNMADRAVAEIYGRETFDPELLQQAGDTLSQNIDKAVKAKGMDYGAAAGDISKLLSKELRNPIYNLNTRKLDQVKQFEQIMARNPNMLVLKNPKNIKLNANTNIEDIGYEVLDPKDANDRFQSLHGKLGKQNRMVGSRMQNGYEMLQNQIGITDAQSIEMKNNPETFNAFVSSMGQLEKYKDDPNVMQNMKVLYDSYVDSLKGGIVEIRGMTPAQIEDRELKKYIELSKLDLAQQKAIRTGGGNSLDRASGFTSYAINSPFKKSKHLIDALTSNDSIKQTKSKDILNQVINPEWVSNILTPAQQEKYGNNPTDILKNIEAEIEDYKTQNTVDSSNDLDYVENVLNKAANWMTSGSGFMGDKKLKEAYKIKTLINNELDSYLKGQGDDVRVPFIGISGDNWDIINTSNGIKNEIMPKQMMFESGDLADMDGDKLHESTEYKTLLKNGFDIHNIYATKDGARFQIRDKSTGNPYIVSLPSTIALKLAGLVSPGIAEAEYYKDINFSGNKLIVPGGEETLPFYVRSEWKKSPRGRKFMYTIEDFTYDDYIKYSFNEGRKQYEPMAKKLKMLGLSDDEIEKRIEENIRYNIATELDTDSKKDAELEEFLKQPYETGLKSDILKIANIL